MGGTGPTRTNRKRERGSLNRGIETGDRVNAGSELEWAEACQVATYLTLAHGQAADLVRQFSDQVQALLVLFRRGLKLAVDVL